MGYAIAEALAKRGAKVTLVAGPTQLDNPENVEVIHVESAEEMFNAVTSRYEEQDIVVKSSRLRLYAGDVLNHKMKNKMAIFLSLLSEQRTF